MYSDYFGFSEAPFSIAPDPRYLYLSDKHREALAHLLYGVGDQGGFILLTGEVGTGKTTICRCLLQQVPENTDVAFIINPRQSINQLLQSIFTELGIPCQRGATSKDMIDQLNHYLLQAHARGRNTIVIIDEAQNLAKEVLEQLRLLTNLETNEKKLLQLLLIGQPELNDLLNSHELRQLSQRVTARYHLLPLSKNEMYDYISHRLSVAGRRQPLFTSSALRSIFKFSGGVPRLINLICDRSLLGVYSQNEVQADANHASQAAREVLGHSQQSKGALMLYASVAAVGLLLASLLALQSGWFDSLKTLVP
jgi:general secretion pathway protein A